MTSSNTALDQEIRDERAREGALSAERRQLLNLQRRQRELTQRARLHRDSEALEHAMQVIPRPESEDDDLATMQRVIERMARREDIPDDWWAAVGLQRSFS